MNYHLTPFAALVLAPLQITDTGPTVKNPLDGVAIQISISEVPSGSTPTQATLSIELEEGLSGTDAGIPVFIVLLDPPAGLELVGQPVVKFEDLRDNEFLMEPWERIVEAGESRIEFKVTPEMAASATLGINVIGYLASQKESQKGSQKGGDQAFLRRRFELEIRGGATAVLGDPMDSSWGPFESLPEEKRPLVIGDKAPDFVGPTLTAKGVGEDASLAAIKGNGPRVLATYRGHW